MTSYQASSLLPQELLSPQHSDTRPLHHRYSFTHSGTSSCLLLPSDIVWHSLLLLTCIGHILPQASLLPWLSHRQANDSFLPCLPQPAVQKYLSCSHRKRKHTLTLLCHAGSCRSSSHASMSSLRRKFIEKTAVTQEGKASPLSI